MDKSETYIKMEQGLPDKPIPHTAVAYLAGLIDGEGTVSLRRKIGNHFNIEVYITSTNKPMLEWVVSVFGGRIYTYNRKGDTTRLPQHKWHLHSRGAEALLRMVLPYLTIKATHARLAINFREYMNRDTSWHREYADKVKEIQKKITYTEPTHTVSQDQLQEMLGFDYKELLFQLYCFIDVVLSTRKYDYCNSMEQLLLAFAIKENHRKIWDGEKWVKSEVMSDVR
jgi:hypothetical protein